MSDRRQVLDLSDEVVLITGGSGALGLVIVETLLAHGARVCNLDSSAASVHDDTVLQCTGDVTDPLQVDLAIDATAGQFGRPPTILLAHAGLVGTHALTDYSVEEFDLLMNVNVRGAFVAARQMARRWRADGLPGHLVFTTSWVHQVAWPEIGPYTASKAAVVQLARAFARELAPWGIRSNAVAPGIVNAGMAKHQWDTDDDYRRRASRAIPLGALQTPQSVADAFLFLCSDLASYMTGSVLTVDGGASLCPVD